LIYSEGEHNLKGNDQVRNYRKGEHNSKGNDPVRSYRIADRMRKSISYRCYLSGGRGNCGSWSAGVDASNPVYACVTLHHELEVLW